MFAYPPPRRLSGRSQRASYHAPRPRKLSAEQEAAIGAEAGTRSLRELAAEFGVSHETIRAVLRERRDHSGTQRTPSLGAVDGSHRGTVKRGR